MEVIKIQTGSMKNNCYLLSSSQGRGILIDPGVDGLAILRTINRHAVDVKAILITHGHSDHTGQIAFLLKELEGEIEVVMHKKDWNGSLHVSRFMKDGERYELDDISLTAILVPGHTHGSLCFYSPHDNCIFTGDTLFYHSIGSEAYYDGDPMDLTNNIIRRLLPLPDITIVYPGHMNDTTILEERTMNRYLTDKDTPDPWEEL